MNTKNEGKANTMGLVVLVLIVIAIGLIAILTDVRRAGYQGAESAVNTATTTEAAASPLSTSTVSASASSPRPLRSVPQASSTQAPPKPDMRLCTANDLTGTASWQGAGGALAGTLMITDSSRSGCSLSHDDYLQILDGGKVLQVGQAANLTADLYTDMRPGQTIPMKFVWRNWCGGALSGAAALRLILPSNGGYLRVPLIDPSGRAQSDSPRCDSPGTYSLVSIWE